MKLVFTTEASTLRDLNFCPHFESFGDSGTQSDDMPPTLSYSEPPYPGCPRTSTVSNS